MTTILSFYLDDTNPYVAPPSAFRTFLDFVAGEGACGESSLILGYDWANHGHLEAPLADPTNEYITQVQRAYACGIDTHCELYTHQGLYDFAHGGASVNGIHEGLWLYEPAVTAAEYESYFAAILDHGDRLGVHFTGLTWPGCGCPACNTRYEALYNQSITTPNQAVWQALLNLVDAGRFRGPALPCFFGEDLPEAAPHLMASSGGSAIYTLPPNAGDRFGVWLNDPRYVNPDYYISANGQAGRIVELVRAGAPYCIFFTHWQGLNPANGVGWQAFTQVIQRVQKHLHRQVEWMRPSQYTTLLLGQPSDN